MRPAAILFDLDDTLADRATALAIYARFLFADFGAYLSDGTVQVVHSALLAADDFGSLRQAQALASALPWKSQMTAAWLHEHWHSRFGGAATFFPGAEEILKELGRREIRMGLVTNGDASMQRAKVAALELDRFMSTILISTEVGLSKPDAAIFNLALKNLGCGASEAWFIGDHPELDIKGAERAGLRAFWVRTGSIDAVGEPPMFQLDQLAGVLNEIGD